MSAIVLLGITIKSTILLSAAWIVARRVGTHRSAAIRHLVRTTALAAVMLLPVITVTAPAWRVAAVPVAWVLQSIDQELPAAPVSAPVPSISDGQPSTRSPRYTWGAITTMAWGLGAVAVLARLIVGLFVLWRLTRLGTPVTNPDWRVNADRAARSLHVGRAVALVSTPRVSVPVVIGFFKPTLLLPPEALAWDGARQRAVLLHELAHISRHDNFFQVVAQLALVIHWFNPFVHHAARRMRDEQELACDDLVLTAGIPASDYAEHLCDIVSAFRAKAMDRWAATAMARPSRGFEGRIRAILDSSRSRARLTPMVRLCALALLSVAVVPLAALRLSSAAPMANGTRSAGHVPDLSGTFALDIALSDPRASWDRDARSSDEEVLTIVQSDGSLRIDRLAGGKRDVTTLMLDGTGRREAVSDRLVDAGRLISGRYVETRWDGDQLITSSTVFSVRATEWSESGMAENLGTQTVSVRRLEADGQFLIVERISLGTWGWAFDGKAPSDAYGRRTDVYRRVGS